MKNYINVNSSEWCDIVFEDKNKEYGAYDMRQSSGRMHLMAFGVTVLFAMAISALPTLIGFVKQSTLTEAGDTYKGSYNMIDMETKTEVEVIIPPQTMEEPPKMKATFKYAPPAIVPDAELDASKAMKSADEALSSTLIISTVHNPEGSLDSDAILPEELTRNRNITGQGTDVKQEPFVHVEQMPAPAGGNDELYKYLNKNMRYPVSAQEANIQGRVIVRFVVSPTGKIENATVLRGIDAACDSEALRVVSNMPSWIPGRQNGRTVPVYFTLPIIFKLSK